MSSTGSPSGRRGTSDAAATVGDTTVAESRRDAVIPTFDQILREFAPVAHPSRSRPPALPQPDGFGDRAPRETGRPPRRATPAARKATYRRPELEPPSEVQLLTEGQRALRVDPRAALSIAHDHRRRYPVGVLDQEREILIFDSLVALGRKLEAARHAERFLERFPAANHSARLRAWLGVVHPTQETTTTSSGTGHLQGNTKEMP